jgi:diguanylate cyclase (GGDEF)-like protein
MIRTRDLQAFAPHRRLLDEKVASLVSLCELAGKGWVLLLGGILVAGFFSIDVVTGIDVSLAVVYLLPIIAVTWITRCWLCGLTIAALASLTVPVEQNISGVVHEPLDVAVWNGVLRLLSYAVVVYLMLRLRALLEQHHGLARSDDLTGLANSRAFRESCALEIERSRRYRHPLSLAYMDLDGFKAINDRRGHGVGDRVLRAFADVARGACRSVDLVARLGGDEFVILMPETDVLEAERVADRVVRKLGQAEALCEEDLTCSIGVVTYYRAPASVGQALHMADALLYEAKTQGKNTVRSLMVKHDPWLRTVPGTDEASGRANTCPPLAGALAADAD